MKEFEIIKCIASDEGWEFVELNEYCIRLQTKTRRYLYDIWVSHHKKNGSFLGYTVHNWKTNEWVRKVQDIAKYIQQ